MRAGRPGVAVGVAIALLLVLPGVAWGARSPSGTLTLPAHGGKPVETANLGVPPEIPRPHAGCPTPVTTTYVVANRSSVPCNSRPVNGNAPDALSLDSADSKLFVAFATSPYIGVVNPTTAALSHLFRIPLPASSLAYDPVNHLLYAGAGPLVIAINVSTDAVVATPVNSSGALFSALAVDPASGTVFAADSAGSSVSMINGSTNGVIATVPVGSEPVALEFYSPTGMLYVADFGANSLSLVDPSQQAVTKVLPVSGSPLSLAAQGDIGELFVSTATETSVIAVGNSTVLGTIPAGGVLGIDPSTEILYIACACDASSTFGSAWGTVAVYNLMTSAFFSNVTVGAGPDAVVLNPVTDVAYSANRDADNLTELLYAPVRAGASVSLGFGPADVASPGNGLVYASLANDLAIEVLSESSGLVQARLPTGVAAGEMVTDLSTGTTYVVEGQGAVAVVDLANNKVSGYLRLPGSDRIADGLPHAGIDLDPSSGHLYVTDPSGGDVNVLATPNGTSVATVPVGLEPAGVAYNALLQQVFVANCGSGNLSVISAANDRPVGSISLGTGTCPDAVLYNPLDGRMYVTEATANAVVVLGGSSDSTVLATLSVGAVPDAILLDSLNNAVYVANRDSSSVSSIVTTGSSFAVTSVFPVGFSPTGLSYDIASDTLFVANMGSGTISSILHPPTDTLYPVSFQESGLPSGDPWTVTLTGATEGSRTPSVPFLETNGTYNFSVGAPNAYVASPESGSVTVSGGAKSVPIVFSHAPPRKYPVTFTENTLPFGATFTVDFNGSTLFVTVSTGLAALAFQAVNGTHPFTVFRTGNYFPYPSNSSVVVAGIAPPNVTVFFTKGAPEYVVEFREQGLPEPSTWSVVIGTTPLTGLDPTLSRSEANGTYHFVASTSVAYTPTPSQGYVTVYGGPKIVNLTFSPNQSAPFVRPGLAILGVPILEFGLLLGAAAGVAALVLVAIVRRGRVAPEENDGAEGPAPEEPPPDPPEEPPPGEAANLDATEVDEPADEDPDGSYGLPADPEYDESSAPTPPDELDAPLGPEAWELSSELAPEEPPDFEPPDGDPVDGSYLDEDEPPPP